MAVQRVLALARPHRACDPAAPASSPEFEPLCQADADLQAALSAVEEVERLGMAAPGATSG